MTLIQRFGYYLGGFAIGLVLLAFFLNGKKVSCSYGPEARVLKNINSKTLIYSDTFQENLIDFGLDSSTIEFILKKGEINFSKSETRKEPCGIYHVEGSSKQKDIAITIENCDSIATLLNIKLIDS